MVHEFTVCKLATCILTEMVVSFVWSAVTERAIKPGKDHTLLPKQQYRAKKDIKRIHIKLHYTQLTGPPAH